MSHLSIAMRAGLTALAIAAVPAAAAAHHGWSEYEDGETTITGTVRSIDLGNPHGQMRIRTAAGQDWAVVMAPPSRTARAGVVEGAVRVGQTVSANGHRHRTRDRLEIKTERLTAGTRTFDIYPDRE